MMSDTYDFWDRIDGARVWDAWLAQQLAAAARWLSRVFGGARKPLSS